MQDNHVDCRLEQLERRVKTLSALAAGASLCLLAVLMVGAAGGDEPAAKAAPSELTVTRLTVVDDQGKPRVIIGQDAKDMQRISRAAGVILYDAAGAERGGFSTMEMARSCWAWTRRLASVQPCAIALACGSKRPGQPASP